MRPWIGVDLDGTLAHYESWQGADHIGAPIPKMVERVKKWLSEGKEVRIFTARVYPLRFVRSDDDIRLLIGADDRESNAVAAAAVIQKWSLEHIGVTLPITCTKDYGMIALYDDRAKQVIKNSGVLIEDIVDPITRGLVNG